MRKLTSAAAIILLTIAFTAVVIEPSQGLDCATFTGQPMAEDASTSEGSNSGFQSEETLGKSFSPVDISHVDLEIKEGLEIPKLDCFSTSNPSAVVAAPTCNVYDQFGNQITTSRPGNYQIRCEGGTFSDGFSPNYKIGKLTVVASQVKPTPTPVASTITPTPVVSPTTPVPSSTPSPSQSPPSTQSVNQGSIDTSAKLLPTGALQECSKYLSIPAVVDESTDQTNPTQPEGGEGVTYVPVEIRSADYRLYENSPWTTFDCTIAQDPTKVVTAPVCSAFDGVTRLTSIPRPGSYEIKCEGVELLAGYSPLIRNSRLTVLALPRVPSPTPTPSAGPTVQPVPSPTPQQTTNPRPSPTPTPTPTPTPSENSSTPASERKAETIFTLKSLDGQEKSVSLLLPSLLLTRETSLELEQSPLTSFIGDYIVIKPVIKRSNNTLSRYSQPISITLPAPSNLGLIPVYSPDGKNWREITQIADAATSVEELAFVKTSAASFTIYSQIAGIFALKIKQNPLILNITSTSSRFIPGDDIQTSFMGGSGSGAVMYESLSPSICSVTDAGVIRALKVGECVIQGQKLADARYVSVTSKQLIVQILASTAPQPSTTPTPKTSPSPKPAPTTSAAPAPIQKDFVILIDSRVGISSRSSKLKWNQASASLPLGKVIQLQISGIDATAQYSIQLILPLGSSVPLSLAAQYNGNLIVQPMQLLRKGNYRLAIQKIGFNQTSITRLKVG